MNSSEIGMNSSKKEEEIQIGGMRCSKGLVVVMVDGSRCSEWMDGVRRCGGEVEPVARPTPAWPWRRPLLEKEAGEREGDVARPDLGIRESRDFDLL